MAKDVKDGPLVDNVNRWIFRHLRIDHRSNQFLDIALSLGSAFREFICADTICFETQFQSSFKGAFTLKGNLELAPGCGSHGDAP